MVWVSYKISLWGEFNWGLMILQSIPMIVRTCIYLVMILGGRKGELVFRGFLPFPRLGLKLLLIILSTIKFSLCLPGMRSTKLHVVWSCGAFDTVWEANSGGPTWTDWGIILCHHHSLIQLYQNSLSDWLWRRTRHQWMFLLWSLMDVHAAILFCCHFVLVHFFPWNRPHLVSQYTRT